MVEFLEERPDGLSKCVFNLADRFLGRKRGDVILQRSQGRDILTWQHVLAPAQRLTELDEGRSKPRKRETQPLGCFGMGWQGMEAAKKATQCESQDLKRDAGKAQHWDQPR